MSARPGLWGHRDFLRLWSAQAISAFGSRITRTALPIIAVATLRESESIVGLLASLQLAPGAILALFAGGFVDRGRKRRILVAADLLRAAFVASLTIAWAAGVLSIVHVFVVGALVGAASALFQITDIAYLPAIVAKEHLAEGNAKLETTEAIAEITGPATAGVLIAALGAPLAVVIDAASYVWSAMMLGRIRAVESTVGPSARPAAPPNGGADGSTVGPSARPAAPPNGGADGSTVGPSARPAAPPNGGAVPPSTTSPAGEPASASIWQSTADLKVGVRAVFGHPRVRPLVLGLMVWTASYGFFAALYTLLCLRTLGLSQATFGIVIAMGGIGSMIGAVISRPLVRRVGLGATLLGASAISVTAGLLIPLAGGSRTTAIVMLASHQLIADCLAVVFNIQAITLRQTVLPREVLGRANAAIHACTAGLVPFAALFAGLLAQATSIRFAMWIGVLIAMLAPIMMWPLRTLREMPASAG